jgi:hypothetical protein
VINVHGHDVYSARATAKEPRAAWEDGVDADRKGYVDDLIGWNGQENGLAQRVAPVTGLSAKAAALLKRSGLWFRPSTSSTCSRTCSSCAACLATSAPTSGLRFLCQKATGLRVHSEHCCVRLPIGSLSEPLGCALPPRWLQADRGVAVVAARVAPHPGGTDGKDQVEPQGSRAT